MKRLIIQNLTAAIALGALGVFTPAIAQEDKATSSEIAKAVAVMHPTKGSDVKGIVTFTEVNGKIHIQGEIHGLEPGEHGFHVHQWGDCSADDATSAGGHFNPTGHPHAAPDADKRHVGDLGNVTAGEDGVAKIDIQDSVLSFKGKESIIGRALIVHEGKDDLTSQPTGDAGGRLACGVIGIAEPK